jgi:serine/threonine protein kinase
VRYDDILVKFPNAELLAEGGQKVVFIVADNRYRNCPCLLKIGSYGSPRILERIRREYDVLKSLDSPHFPKCYEMRVVDDQRFYLIEERLPGQPLTEAIADFQEPARALRLIMTLLEALNLLWQRNVIHRDVKPANILIGEKDHVYIIDLGIARLLDEDSLTHSLNGRGPCTPVYAAPEQLRNKKHEINHRCDQFAVGIILAQLLLGGPHPFDPQLAGAGDNIVENILNGKWASTVIEKSPCSHFVPVLTRMLATEPHGRYRTPALLKSAIESLKE